MWSWRPSCSVSYSVTPLFSLTLFINTILGLLHCAQTTSPTVPKYFWLVRLVLFLVFSTIGRPVLCLGKVCLHVDESVYDNETETWKHSFNVFMMVIIHLLNLRTCMWRERHFKSLLHVIHHSWTKIWHENCLAFSNRLHSSVVHITEVLGNWAAKILVNMMVESSIHQPAGGGVGGLWSFTGLQICSRCCLHCAPCSSNAKWLKLGLKSITWPRASRTTSINGSSSDLHCNGCGSCGLATL